MIIGRSTGRVVVHVGLGNRQHGMAGLTWERLCDGWMFRLSLCPRWRSVFLAWWGLD